MNNKIRSIRTFIGAKNFIESRAFYNNLGFKEIIIDDKMSHFVVTEQIGFYLQDYYVKDWIENSMVFLDVDNIEFWHFDMVDKTKNQKYDSVKTTEIKTVPWGREFFMHDPSGVLWIFGEFQKNNK